MIPTAILELPAMPVTRTGKVDRKALPAWDFRTESAGGREPSTPTEELFARLFAEVLNLDAVTADDNFFALGGDSIVSMQLVALAKSAGLTITGRQIFEAKTVAALAALADPDGSIPAGPGPVSEETADRAAGLGTVADFGSVSDTDAELLAHRYPNLSEVWPLSPTQSGIHFHSTLDPTRRTTTPSSRRSDCRDASTAPGCAAPHRHWSTVTTSCAPVSWRPRGARVRSWSRTPRSPSARSTSPIAPPNGHGRRPNASPPRTPPRASI